MLSRIRGVNSSENANYAICPGCQTKIAVELWNKQTRAFLGDNIPSIVNGQKTKIPYQCPECYAGYLSKFIKFVI